jgi:hypothetical protein
VKSRRSTTKIPETLETELLPRLRVCESVEFPPDPANAMRSRSREDREVS